MWVFVMVILGPFVWMVVVLFCVVVTMLGMCFFSSFVMVLVIGFILCSILVLSFVGFFVCGLL